MKLTSGILYDTLYTDMKYRKPFVLTNKIKPAWNFNTVLFGNVFTCLGTRVLPFKNINDNIRLTMLNSIPKNCIMVYATEGCYEVAHFGDITALIAKTKQCQGAIIDGNTRDIEGIEKLKFPVFCRELNCIDSFGTWGIINFNCNIAVSGINGLIEIKPKDYVFADKTSILIIPFNLITEVKLKALKRIEAEERLKKTIKQNPNINLIEAYKNEGIH